MVVHGIKELRKFCRSHADAKAQVDSWILAVESEEWSGPADLKRRYPNASILEGNRVIFNIRGNNYRLVTIIDYETKIVFVDWIGTHPEYDRLVF
jgi:mRNA interferase HigB